MAGFEPRMPSADEDFDAVAAPPRKRKPRTPSAPRAHAQPVASQPTSTHAAARPVQPVRSQPSRPVAVAVAEPIHHDEPARQAVESPKQAVEPVNHDQQSYQPDPEPMADEIDSTTAEPLPIVHHKPAKQPKAAKAPKQPRTPEARLALRHMLIEGVLLAVVVGFGFWIWNLHTDRTALRHEVSALEANPQVAIQKQTDTLIQTVGGLITLPAGETPTIANVSDANQARQQSAFFQDAQDGDKVLMYVKAGEAILYRPTTNKIILVAPLTFDGAASPNASPAATTKP